MSPFAAKARMASSSGCTRPLIVGRLKALEHRRLEAFTIGQQLQRDEALIASRDMRLGHTLPTLQRLSS
jgi:hypothetical protein